MAILLLSQGVPLIHAGDEVLRTQHGNNNTWCQDNELGWFDWSLLDTNRDMLTFTRELIAFRKRHPCLMHTRFLTGMGREGQWFPDISWHGRRLNQPLWDDPEAQLLACTLGALEPWEEDLHIILNMSADSLQLPLPGVPGRDWYRAIDTARPSPGDVLPAGRQTPLHGSACRVKARSIVVFEARAATGAGRVPDRDGP
jgi:glycogen operon protein